MNEYLVEDEYSFYEIDSECKIEYPRGETGKERISKLESEEYGELTTDGCTTFQKEVLYAGPTKD